MPLGDSVRRRPSFQFHSGSIQTTVRQAAVGVPGSFQFHSGSIQTRKPMTWRINSRRVSIPLWFDSNRAEVEFFAADHVFQFHSGSIQTAPSLCVEAYWRTFQFHSGSIQTGAAGLDTEVSIEFQFHSGSIQTPTGATPTSFVSVFQFHSGSIQTFQCQTLSVECECFNSTLVRFKLPLPTATTSPWTGFQFHSGSIQTRRMPPGVLRRRMFQFHSGSIQTPAAAPHNSASSAVSIPLWFDSNWAHAEPVRRPAGRFNSTLVRFKPQGALYRNGPKNGFNSTLVRFKLG